MTSVRSAPQRSSSPRNPSPQGAPANDRRERLRKLEMGHIQLGKLLHDAMGMDPNEPLAPHLSEVPLSQRLAPRRQTADVAASTSILSSHDDRSIAAVSVVSSRSPSSAAVNSTTQNRTAADELKLLQNKHESGDRGQLVALTDHPLVLSMEKEIEGLRTELSTARAATAAMTKKAEALARNLVKALRERNLIEEELVHNREHSNTTRKSTEPTLDVSVHHQLKETYDSMQRVKEDEIQQLLRELDRLVALGLRNRSSALINGAPASSSNDSSSWQAKLREVEDEKRAQEASLGIAMLHRDQLAAELRLSAECIETLDQRLLISEQELLHARLTAADATSSPADLQSNVPEPLDLTSLPLSARKHIARLSAEVAALQQHVEHQRHDYQVRCNHLNDLARSAREHAAVVEEHLSDVQRERNIDRQELLRLQRTVDAFDARLTHIQELAALTASTIGTSRADVDDMVALATTHAPSSSTTHQNTLVDCAQFATKVRIFVMQVSRDFAAASEFLNTMRNMRDGSIAAQNSGAQNSGGEVDPHHGSHNAAAGKRRLRPIRAPSPPQPSELVTERPVEAEGAPFSGRPDAMSFPTARSASNSSLTWRPISERSPSPNPSSSKPSW